MVRKKKQKRVGKKKKQNKTRIMTNQDRKHGSQIKTDTMDAVTEGKLRKWTRKVMMETKRITNKVYAATKVFTPFYHAVVFVKR